MIRVGDTIKKLREERKLSKAELSTLTGIDYDLLCRYEENRLVPNVSDVSKMAAFFEVNIGVILENLKGLVF